MRILSERRFRVNAAPSEVWAALARVDDYPAWWPWLRRFDAGALAAGEWWRATIRPPLPYRLRFRVELVAVEAPRLVSARVWGDLLGRAAVSLLAADGGASTDIVIASALEAHSLAARAGARALPGVARRGHDHVLDAGAAQFAAANGWHLGARTR